MQHQGWFSPKFSTLTQFEEAPNCDVSVSPYIMGRICSILTFQLLFWRDSCIYLNFLRYYIHNKFARVDNLGLFSFWSGDFFDLARTLISIWVKAENFGQNYSLSCRWNKRMSRMCKLAGLAKIWPANKVGSYLKLDWLFQNFIWDNINFGSEEIAQLKTFM